MTAITRVGTVIVPVSDQDRVLRIGDFVPPMFTFRDPDGNRFRMVERD